MSHPYHSSRFTACFEGLAHIRVAKSLRAPMMIRKIPGCGYKDAVIAAPRLTIPDQQSCEALAFELRDWDIISVVIIPDPLIEGVNYEACFDVVRLFKTHYVYNPAQAHELKGFHKSNTQLAQKRLCFERIDFGSYLKRWLELWGELVERHDIQGLARFSGHYFESLAKVPGLVAFGAFEEGEQPEAISLWFENGDMAVSHLNVCSARGYKAQANYGIYDFMMREFAGKALVDLGSNFGIKDDPEDGLSSFKQGFSNMKRQSYICGLVCDRKQYEALCKGKDSDEFFPAYRDPKVRS